MSDFSDWFTERMANINYKLIGHMDNDECSWMKFADANDRFHVFYAKKPITPEIIRTTFAMENEPILFVIDVMAMPSFNNVDVTSWMRALHAIYYGRIYFWNGQEIKALHFDWIKNNSFVSEAIDMSGILFTRVDSQLRDFPGLFFIARFYDKAFWKEQPKQQKGESWKERAKKQREEWEQATKGHSTSDRKYQYQQDSESAHSRRHTEEDIYEAFKRAFYEHMNNWGAYTHERTSQQRYTPQGDKWFTMLVQTGSLAEARKVYLRLAKENHPDINKSPEATAIMQQVNAAWEKVQEYLV